MPEISLYNAWTMKLPLPEPFQKIMEKTRKKRMSCDGADCSIHNKRQKGQSAKLHPPTLSALLSLIEIKAGAIPGACGIQEREKINYFLMEYEKPEGRCVLVYNQINGRFTGQRIVGEKKEKLLCVEKEKNSGEEYLALLAYASLLEISSLYDGEFFHNFSILSEQYQKGWKNQEAVMRAAFICCDNLYRRLTAPPKEAIPLEQTQLYEKGKMDFLASYKMAQGVYEPNAQIWGTFEYLKAQTRREETYTIADMKKIYGCDWEVPEDLKGKIPSLPENYTVSEGAEEILQRIVDSPARMFMVTGKAGIGKTTEAQIIAQILGLPYYVFTCGPDTDETTLLASVVPNMGRKAEVEQKFPVFEDLMMDPATALSMVSGSYQDEITQKEAFEKLMEIAYQKGYEQAKSEKDFLLRESEIVKACREACVLEIQEPFSVLKPGTFVRLNSLFDDGARTDLLDGETIHRNPNTIVIMTTNLNYAGCQVFNASVSSRMALVQHRDDLSVEDMVARAVKRTGFADEDILFFMASTVKKIAEHIEKEEWQDGVCGYREMESWVWSYKTTGNLLRAVKNTVLSKASPLAEDRKLLMETYIEPYFNA